MATTGREIGCINGSAKRTVFSPDTQPFAHALFHRPGGLGPSLSDHLMQLSTLDIAFSTAADEMARSESDANEKNGGGVPSHLAPRAYAEAVAAVVSAAHLRDEMALSAEQLMGLLEVALADHDAIMSADFTFGEACHATTADFLALLDSDEFDDDDDHEHDHDDDTTDDAGGNRASEPTETETNRLRALAAHLDTCAFCRWRARLAWGASVPADERDLVEELERLIVEPAVMWRELELEWLEAASVVHASTGVAVAAPAVVCLDGKSAERIKFDHVSEPKWRTHGNGRGHLSLTVFGIPNGFSRYRLVLFAGHHLRKMLELETGEPDDLLLPSLDLIERHAPELLNKLAPTHGLPPMALPIFSGLLTPYGDKCSLNWTSPPVGQVRLRSDDIILACLF